MNDNIVKLNEKTEKLDGMEKRAMNIEADSKNYLERAKEINRQQKEKASGGFLGFK
jgi:uncharacterized protein YaiL (DUF2058 family)